MPLELDEYDISILKSLFKDGRKSFRQVSRETGITTPTVKARFERLVNVGFIRGVQPIIDFRKIEKSTTMNLQNAVTKNQPVKKIKEGVCIQLDCDFCHGIIAASPHVIKFVNYERFFCCSSCKSEYKRKYGGRIQAIIENHEKSNPNTWEF
ncbi:MAG TPA: AsnC family transcriptional regulator [Nitrososphaeraceae archaeon]